jgi:uncharacterized PurR-regulated membrane protein YhhQ (DUF165 family)
MSWHRMKPAAWQTPTAVIVYVCAIALANVTVALFGPAWSVANAFVLIGLDLSLRDYLHDGFRGRRAVKLGAMIVAGGLLGYAVDPGSGRIAVASAVAFIVSATADSLAYHLLRRREWITRANGSNVAGAGVDSILFPALAFGLPLLWPIVLGQFVAKLAGGAVWSLVLERVRRSRASSYDG